MNQVHPPKMPKHQQLQWLIPHLAFEQFSFLPEQCKSMTLLQDNQQKTPKLK